MTLQPLINPEALESLCLVLASVDLPDDCDDYDCITEPRSFFVRDVKESRRLLAAMGCPLETQAEGGRS